MEEWKIIKDYENYEISNFGNVRNKKTGRIMKLTINHLGYLVVTLCKNCKKLNHYIHRLVAQHFIINEEEKKEIDHKDRNKQNNHFNNLIWCSRSENNINKKAISIVGEKNISQTIYNTFDVYIQRNKQTVFRKTFKTLEDAIKARDELLKD